MYLLVLFNNQMIDKYLKAEKIKLHHRFIQNKISRRGRKRVNKDIFIPIIT